MLQGVSELKNLKSPRHFALSVSKPIRFWQKERYIFKFRDTVTIEFYIQIGGNMTKKVTAFDGHYDIQESWIRRQIDRFKHDSFVDLYIAQKEIETAGITAFASPKETAKFREKHLSKSGKAKLSSSLRTYKKRNNQKLTTRRLDLNISLPAHIALEALASELRLTKTQLIEQLILDRRKKQTEEV